MTLPAPTYDLVLLLDTQVEEAVRTKILSDAREAISAQGELLRHDPWGTRALAYPIEKKTDAEYHLMQFHASNTGLLAGLDRSLRIADGVVRFRIVKLAPGTPDAPDMQPGAAAARPAAAEPAVEPPAPPEPAAAEAPVAEPA
jgi:small subunit ribosomal protein S6